MEPIAILAHPHQPLSYVESVIQSELAPIRDSSGQLRPPTVTFTAQQLDELSIRPKRQKSFPVNEGGRRTPHVEKRSKTGQQFVRWAQCTEISDFVRDVSRAHEFTVTVEGAPAGFEQIQVTVPSFAERTHFLRMKLRKISRQLRSTAAVKHECDVLAQRGGQRVALSGLLVLSSWWCVVYICTFQTELGWDTMEPVTYLVSMSTLIGGYLWFLYHNREISYKSALDFTISARQKRLYQSRGVDLRFWEGLLEEGKATRHEIMDIAAEFGVEYDERADEQDEQVREALKDERDDDTNMEESRRQRG